VKKTLLLIVAAVLSIVLLGCSQKEEYKVYAVVHYESNLMGGTTDKIIFGTQYSLEGKKSTVYFYSEKKNAIQLQPTKLGNTIYNVNAPWSEIKSIESIGFKNVYYNSSENYSTKHELINDSEIEVFKITRHQNYGSMIEIDEIYVINVEDITAFEFVYKVDELE
jgi:hypothetical protein